MVFWYFMTRKSKQKTSRSGYEEGLILIRKEGTVQQYIEVGLDIFLMFYLKNTGFVNELLYFSSFVAAKIRIL